MIARLLWARRIAAHLTIAFLLAPLGAAFSEGSSTVREDAASFSHGSFDRTIVVADALALDYERGTDDSWPDNWTQLHHGRPGNLTLQMAYDSANNVLVMEEGGLNEPHNFTWIYDFDTANWTRRSPPVAPPYADVIAYDSRNGVVVVYYCRSTRLIPGETWIYNVTLNDWSNRTTAIGPADREKSAMVYDSANGVTVLFGGGSPSYANETWTYNCSTCTWTNMSPANPPPSRGMHAMAFDESCGEVLLFGGTNRTAYNDTWAYNVTSNAWTQLAPAASPPPMTGCSMVYDSSSGQTVLFGGQTGSGYSRDTWTYRSGLKSWVKMNPANAPSNRSNSAAAYNSRENQVVLFGGSGYYGSSGDLWSYDSSSDNWSDMTRSDIPFPRVWHTMALEERLGKPILFGGGYSSGALRCDTYSFDSPTGTWRQLFPANAPGARGATQMVYDGVEGEMVMFGGFSAGWPPRLGDTWTYNATANAWTNKDPSNPPAGRSAHAMAFDSSNGRTVLFGGVTMSGYACDTWSYSASTNSWKDLTSPIHPKARSGAVMAYDAQKKLCVLFGGFDRNCLYTDTWIFNVATDAWVNKTPARSPPGRASHTLVWDGQRGGIVLFGGADTFSNTLFNDTWIYDTTSFEWMPVDCARTPAPRRNFAAAYDSTSHAILLFGGTSPSGSIYGDTWAFDLKHHTDSGLFTSTPLDTGGNAHYGNLEWDADTPAGATVRFQSRAADAPSELDSRPFIGPDGTFGTFYTASGIRIHSSHNGSRWFQYRLSLSTADCSATPRIGRIVVHYNLPPVIRLLSPIGGENWTGENEIEWTASSGDGDPLSFDILLIRDSGTTALVTGLPEGTGHWTWNTCSTSNGTCRVRIVAHDMDQSIPVSANITSDNLTIHHPAPPNRRPHVELASPPDGSAANATSVRLEWRGSDPDGDPLTYTVSYSVLPLHSGQARTDVTNEEYLDLSGLQDNATYYWTVDANDTKTNLTDIATPVWRFTVRLPPVNHHPKITSTPASSVMVGGTYEYNVKAFDADNDTLVFSMAPARPDMAFDNRSGRLLWWPTAADVGNRTVTVEVSDGRGGTDRQTFVVTVVLPERPLCSFTYPADGSTARGPVEVRGTAARGTFPLVIVRLRIDGGEWTTAVGLENWSLVIDTGGLSNGAHRLEAWAFDGTMYSETASMKIVVDNEKAGSAGFDYLRLALPVIIIVTALLGAAVWARGRR